MNSIVISSTKTKFIKKSFLNYKKQELLENFKHEILNENLDKSYFLLFDMINSGFFKDIWTIYFNIFTEYIHILNPTILKIIHTNFERFKIMKKNSKAQKINILEARNEFNFRKIMFMILKKLVKTPKKHIGYFIPQSFNNQRKITSTTPLLTAFDGKNIPNLNILKEVINNQDYKDVEHAMKEFHHFIEYAIHKKYIQDQDKFHAKDTCFYWLAKILVIGAENTNIIGYPYNISLYHSIDPNSKDYFSPLVWNIILNGSKKLGKDYFNHNVILYKIFNSNLLQKTKRENFLVIQAILFFFEYIQWTGPQITLLDDDYDTINQLYQEYQNIQIKKPKRKVKLKTSEHIEEHKDDIEKIIQKRQAEIKDIIPKPPPINFEMISKNDSSPSRSSGSKSKKKKKGKKKKDEDDEEYELPDVFNTFEPPSKRDIKTINSMKLSRVKTSNQQEYKPITVVDGKFKRTMRGSSNTKFNITKIE